MCSAQIVALSYNTNRASDFLSNLSFFFSFPADTPFSQTNFCSPQSSSGGGKGSGSGSGLGQRLCRRRRCAFIHTEIAMRTRALRGAFRYVLWRRTSKLGVKIERREVSPSSRMRAIFCHGAKSIIGVQRSDNHRHRRRTVSFDQARSFREGRRALRSTLS